jgi:hypothetical protein
MTTHPPDETLSALLDHEPVDTLDAAHVEECSACRDRLHALRDVSNALGEPIAAPAHVRDAAVAAALVETSGTSGAVRRLTMARRTRAKAAANSGRRMSAVSAAAALVVALGVGAWLVSQAGGKADKTTGTNSASALAGGNTTNDLDLGGLRPASGGTGAGATGGSNAAADSAVTPMGYQAGELGEFSDIDDLAAVAKRDLAQSDEVKAQHVAFGSPCPLPPASEQLWTAHITYQGQDASAWVRTTESGRLLEILDVHSACAVVESRAI